MSLELKKRIEHLSKWQMLKYIRKHMIFDQNYFSKLILESFNLLSQLIKVQIFRSSNFWIASRVSKNDHQLQGSWSFASNWSESLLNNCRRTVDELITISVLARCRGAPRDTLFVALCFRDVRYGPRFWNFKTSQISGSRTLPNQDQ